MTMNFKNDKQRKAVMCKLHSEDGTKANSSKAIKYTMSKDVALKQVIYKVAEKNFASDYQKNLYVEFMEKRFEPSQYQDEHYAKEWAERLKDTNKFNAHADAKSRKVYDTIIKKNPDYLYSRTSWSESELKIVQRRINDKKITVSELFKKNKQLDDGSGIVLSDDQQQKGLKWLHNQWQTKTGKTRTNNPFGYREQEVLNKQSEIRVKDFYSERGNWYSPLYEVSSSGGSFEYVVVGGEVKIMG